jgi:4,5-DOPA dioxygenase extradiol
MTSPAKAPVLFISHGAPTFALEPGLLGPRLRTLGRQLPELKAVLVVSPHWQTKDVMVMSTALPETVHDFGGFPSSLYALQYRAAGQPELAQEAARLLNAVPGFRCSTCCPRPRCRFFKSPCLWA